MPYLNPIMEDRLENIAEINFDEIKTPFPLYRSRLIDFSYSFDSLSVRMLVDKLLYYDKKLDTKLCFGSCMQFGISSWYSFEINYNHICKY